MTSLATQLVLSMFEKKLKKRLGTPNVRVLISVPHSEQRPAEVAGTESQGGGLLCFVLIRSVTLTP
jgi:hypothetical protein